MTWPVEYQNLIARRALEIVEQTSGAVQAFLLQAENYLASAKQIDPKLAMQVFTNAYEGYFQLVDAFLEHYKVRTKEAGRNLVIQRVSADLKLSPEEMRVVIRARERRNGTSYHSPFPPISRAEAMGLLGINRLAADSDASKPTDPYRDLIGTIVRACLRCGPGAVAVQCDRALEWNARGSNGGAPKKIAKRKLDRFFAIARASTPKSQHIALPLRRAPPASRNSRGMRTVHFAATLSRPARSG